MASRAAELAQAAALGPALAGAQAVPEAEAQRAARQAREAVRLDAKAPRAFSKGARGVRSLGFAAAGRCTKGSTR